MIGIGPGTRVMVATRPVDFRKGPDALAALVSADYGGDAFSGVIYVFRAKRADRIKLIWWDGTGLCLMAKCLEQGGFKWPGIQDGVMRLSAAQLGALLEGLDWRRVHGGRRPQAPQIAKLDRSTLADWVGRAAWYLRPLRDRTLEELRRSERLFADETTAPVLDPGRGRTKTGQLWAYARDDRPWGGVEADARGIAKLRRSDPAPATRWHRTRGGGRQQHQERSPNGRAACALSAEQACGRR